MPSLCINRFLSISVSNSFHHTRLDCKKIYIIYTSTKTSGCAFEKKKYANLLSIIISDQVLIIVLIINVDSCFSAYFCGWIESGFFNE